MPAIPRQKACIACAESKRRCDKQLPECRRCLRKDIHCVYPQPKSRRRYPLAYESQAERLVPAQNATDNNARGSSLDFADWDAIDFTELDFSLPDVTTAEVPTLPAPSTGALAGSIVPDNRNLSNMPHPWFLQDETWVMQQNNQEPACSIDLELERFIDAVEAMLQLWVKNGYNGFIHRRLYEEGMPTCLQDAFTTLATYNGRFPAVKRTILQIAEERSCALTSQSLPTACGTQGILGHLARVQSLFIYVFIRLFDGSVRARAAAERQLQKLRSWVKQMWEAVIRYREGDSYGDHRFLQWTANVFDREYDTVSELWRLWILTESVRRSQLIIDTVTNVYPTMTKGRAYCTGAAMFTARRGLWDAESAVEWFELSCAKAPLLVSPLQPEALISQHTAEDLDDFARVVWICVIGTEKLQCWIDRSSRTSRTCLTVG
ncbi:uncharacterized protein Z518_00258 [Rhinocladiella mackenziei CBS 650.93]|uniref:Rhinocladiella mackenziei CBS 650.93 unplaced genomic scaffold supercont1.1, whole genome shotgun sequence n=1 Tax=Rhinocladiella mackenziei CBS 650.93 TaxID=1442369 RepID=A0A0D2IT26_9EURO|nr:uncharacterized protein Z518_00258 [Rhinocladiella mackenziei CBS 650.93]KIX09179.1 hypothetical protein Z518_00258 [Rhinocladiella mackenziei CBS 650.93]